MNQQEFITIERKEYDAILLRLGHLEGQPPANKRRGFWGWFLQRSLAVLVALMMAAYRTRFSGHKFFLSRPGD